MLKTLSYYMALPYTIDVDHEESGEAPPFVASIRELPGCMAQGATHNEAVQELREAQSLFVETLLEHGVSVPEPTYTAEATKTKATYHFLIPENPVPTPSTSLPVPSELVLA